MERLITFIGINPESWEETNEKEKKLLLTSIYFFLTFVGISLIGGIQLMYSLSDSILIGFFGGAFVAFMLSGMIRLAIITTITQPHREKVIPFNNLTSTSEEKNKQNIPNNTSTPQLNTARTILNNVLSKIKRIKIPFTDIIRVFFVAMICINIGLPFLSVILYPWSQSILSNRQNEVIAEFSARHPEYNKQRIAHYRELIMEEHFPIHVYRKLLSSPITIFLLGVICYIALKPLMIILKLRNNDQSTYFKFNDKLIVNGIRERYEANLSKSEEIFSKKYPNENIDLRKSLIWEDPPINSKKKILSKYQWCEQSAFLSQFNQPKD